ncbi:MAG TPA: hypothetical protein VLC07_09715, partial [Solirubrobacterales bacterium]|nr:hypothetical protein [Solirubrobacterales bacterium]
DFDLNLAVAREFPICSHGALVAEHREHSDNMSDDAGKMLEQTLIAMRKQKPYLSDRERKRAYREGMQNWKHYWGDLLAAQAARARREGRWGDALRGAAKLLRYRPGALPRIFGSGDTAAA